MSLAEQINEDIKAAMKAKDKVKLGALRGVKKEIIEAGSAKGASGEITNEEVIKIIQKLVKQRKDSADLYIAQQRKDLADEELAEVDAIKAYLPTQLSADELSAAIKSIIEKTGAASMKEMGKVMGVASKELAGKAEGKDISATVKALLS